MVLFLLMHFQYCLTLIFPFYLFTAEQPAIVVIFNISEGGKSLFLFTNSETKFFEISSKVNEIFEFSCKDAG